METSRLVELLEVAFRRVRRRLIPIAGAEGVSLTELNVLGRVSERRRCRMTEIAEDVGMPPTTLTGIVDRLVARRLLTRQPDPDDRRAILLGVGEQLAPLMERVQQAKRERLAGLFDALPPEHLAQLAVVLQEVLDGLDRSDGVRS